jgi:hypothetical protein
MLQDWNAVVAIGCTLPGVEPGTSYGRPALRFRGLDEKDILLDTDPATFWQTDHYDGWPAVLVRYGTGAGERIADLLARAWWDRATSAQRKAYGERP